MGGSAVVSFHGNLALYAGPKKSLYPGKNPDSLATAKKPASDTAQAKLKLTGEVIVEGRYSEVDQPFQTIPNNYIRTTVNSTIQAFGLPLQFGMLYSTENNTNHKINGIRIGFSNELLLTDLRKKMLTNANDERFATELDSLNGEYAKARLSTTSIEKEFSTPEYQDKLSTSADVISSYGADIPGVDTPAAGLPEGYRYAESKAFIVEHRGKVKELGEARSRMKQIEARQREIQLIKQNNTNNLADESAIKRSAGSRLPLGYRVALSVKRLEIGKFSPNYNSLLLDGTSLLGVNIELNPGILYGAFCYGSLDYIFNASRPGEYVSAQRSVFSQDADVYWFRAGIRNGSRFSVILNQVIANVDRKQQEGTQRLYRNTVIGADIAYQNKGHLVKVEMAQSTYGSRAGYGETLKNINTGSEFNYAVKSQYRVVLKKSHNVDLTLGASYVAPDYFSICVPFMRKDNLKLAVGTGASVWKKIFRLELGVRNEQDNFYRKSPISNNIVVYNFSVAFRYKMYPFVQLQASPGFNRMLSLTDNKSYRQEFSLYSLSSGYSYRRKETTCTLTAFTGYSSYMQLFASDSVSYFKNYQAGGSISILFKKPGIELGTNASAATATERPRQFMWDSKIIKWLGKHAIGAGYAQAKDPWNNKTAFYYCTLAAVLPFNMRLNAKGGYNRVAGIDPVYGRQDQGLIININLSKKF